MTRPSRASPCSRPNPFIGVKICPVGAGKTTTSLSSPANLPHQKPSAVKRLAILLLLITSAQCLSAQVYMRQYKIASDGVNLGNLTVRKTVMGDTITYGLTSDIIVNMIAKIYVETRMDATFVSGQLHTSSSAMFLDQNPINQTRAVQTQTGMELDRNGYTSKSIETPPYTSLRLYFEMPPERTKVFSELDGNTRNMRKKEDKVFELIDPESPKRKSTYTYSSEEGLFSIDVEFPHLPPIKISQVREPVAPDAADPPAEE